MTPAPSTEVEELIERCLACLRGFVDLDMSEGTGSYTDQRHQAMGLLCALERSRLSGSTSTGGAAKSWRCFYCDEVFADEQSARDHFGSDDNTKEGCACQITRDEKGLVALLRQMWNEVNVYRTENDAQTKLFYSLGSDHAVALRRTEEAGYEKGLADGRAPSPGACQPPQWQEIASAPRDDAKIMLGIVRAGVLEEIHIGGYRFADSEDESDCWWSDQADDEIQPTHWARMLPEPLHRPAPPRGEKEE